MKGRHDGLARCLSKRDLERIREAVGKAEKGISGEIVPYIVTESDSYPEAAWSGAAAGAVLACLSLMACDWQSPLWHPLGLMILAVPAGGALGWALSLRVPALRRWLIGPERLARMAERRAREAFLEKEVFRTRERTGILLFVSIFEHQVVVLGDAGINAKLKPADWGGVVARVTTGVEDGQLAEGIVGGVGRCRELLLGAGFKAREDDTDELGDEPHFGGGKP